MWRCRELRRADGTYRHSMPAIARVFEGRDHTTILHGVRRHAARIAAKEPA
jgi:chromosomal replication initiation ATPase DnaA